MATNRTPSRRSIRRELAWFAVLVLLLASVFDVIGPAIGSLSAPRLEAIFEAAIPASATL